MRGFQPQEQRFADGGLVQRAMGFFGGRKKQLDDAVAAAEGRDPGRGAAGGQPQKPAPQPQPAPVVTTRDGKFDERRASSDNPAGIGFADGGRVQPRGFVVGPGTETSDSIPARLSNGEYVLPADTVRSVGVDKLDALREATHDPARGQSGKKGPEFFFAGGTPEGVDGVKKAYDDWQESKPSWFAQQTPTSAQKERDAEAAYGKALQDSYRTNINGGQPGSTLGQPPVAPQDGKAPDPNAAPSAAPQQSAFDANTAKDNTYGLAPVNRTSLPSADDATGQKISPGVYQHGRGQYSDSASGMGFAAGFTGQPSGKNMEAADALDARQHQASSDRINAQQQAAPRGFAPGAQSNYTPGTLATSEWAQELAMRNASVGSTIFRNSRERADAMAERKARMDGVQNSINQQMHDAQQADTARYQSDSSLAGHLGAEQMRQQGESARADQSNALDRSKLALDAQARGFDIRRGQRMESIYAKYDAAKTDAERAAAARSIRDLSGQKQDPQYEFKFSPNVKNMDGSTTEGGLWRVDPYSGTAVDMRAGNAAVPSKGSLVKDQTYQTPNGAMTWNGSGFDPVK